MRDTEAQILSESTYLGDGVYAHLDTESEAVTLLTSDGASITNCVYLDRATLAAFRIVLERVGAER
jgi:hypothetical protein